MMSNPFTFIVNFGIIGLKRQILLVDFCLNLWFEGVWRTCYCFDFLLSLFFNFPTFSTVNQIIYSHSSQSVCRSIQEPVGLKLTTCPLTRVFSCRDDQVTSRGPQEIMM